MNRLSLVVSVASALVACTGTDTGNPFQQPVTIDAHSSSPADVAIQEDLGGVVVTEAWLSIGTMELVSAADCRSGGAVTIPSIGVGDHAAADVVHLDVSIPTDDYCKLLVPFAPAVDGAAVPATVVGASFYLAGSTANGTAFVLRSAAMPAVEVTTLDSSFELANDLGGLFLGFDVATWLGGLDFAGATIDGDNVIVIDSLNNSDLLAGFEDNLSSGLELYRDADENGQPGGPDDIVLARGL